METVSVCSSMLYVTEDLREALINEAQSCWPLGPNKHALTLEEVLRRIGIVAKRVDRNMVKIVDYQGSDVKTWRKVLQVMRNSQKAYGFVSYRVNRNGVRNAIVNYEMH